MPIEEIPLNADVPKELIDALRRSKRYGPNMKVVVGAAILDALRTLQTSREGFFDMIGAFNIWVDEGCPPIHAPPLVKKSSPEQPKDQTVARQRRRGTGT
jgi:hypothetical protein